MRRLMLAAMLTAAASGLHAQQVPDRGYRAAVGKPQYATNSGPVVCVDEAHANFHTLGERFWAFGELLRQDGFRVQPSVAVFNRSSLEACAVLVISNAQPNKNGWNTYPYPTPSAFTAEEIVAVRAWVDGGGALLLIADHMPLAGAAAGLAQAFDVAFMDGFAMRERDADPPDIFSIEDKSLREHAITRGRDARESVSRVATFTGQAFRAPHAEALLVIPEGFVGLMPRTAWQFSPDTPRVDIRGWLQGAVQPVGKGRAAFFGEAAMFSAQLAGPEKTPMGMNSPGAESNFQFVLNVMHWLTRTL